MKDTFLNKSPMLLEILSEPLVLDAYAFAREYLSEILLAMVYEALDPLK